ncbi:MULTISPECIES: YdcH family protein [Helicobacter]|uniref:YdcH family protein n=1 Tax=Helicobacter ibis TaxID=2962633 RepID=A0ABT4VE58_9HELI|nr:MULTISPECIES: YdcH family protein [Helicobacter]MDA3966416.1 YdcH family protein [Helicobacter sp. WB40]MDA3968969.1 YdcH family protein [Helicobacter ibis]
MLHEYRDEISVLKQENAHFAKIFDEHNELDQKIQNISEGREHASDAELGELKRKKLVLKDEAYAMIMEYKKTH